MAPRVAVVDYEMGNLFSVLQACQAASLDAFTTQKVDEVAAADLVILPGVGGFPQAMASLRQRGLDVALRQYAASGRPIVGVCLGQQLLMEYSDEFGRTEGLGLIAGSVVKLPDERDKNGRALKIPHMGWVPIRPAEGGQAWAGTPLDGIEPGASMYFVSGSALEPCRHSRRIAVRHVDLLRLGPSRQCLWLPVPSRAQRSGWPAYLQEFRHAACGGTVR
jgi:glutamine amidotransferase